MADTNAEPTTNGEPDLDELFNDERRRKETAIVLAETLLDLWLADRRARRQPGSGGSDV